MIADTLHGKVEGREKDGVLLFAGIPYAAAPVGERRFRPPAPHAGWDGVRPATQFGRAAPQKPRAGSALPGIDLEWDEDCLFLNVVTPAADDGRRPVMVWIHGGAFVTGSGRTPWYNGVSFARRHDVVVVTINYRLGALGFLHLGGLDDGYASSGINGILDQVAALEWVRDNVAAFGGDPGNVTIFGESAGGMSVATLLGVPAARGLFHKAIPQSGAAHHTLDPGTAGAIAARFCEAADARSVEELLALPVERLLDAQLAVEEALLADPAAVTGEDGAPLTLPYRPVVDGAHLPRSPIDAVHAGEAAGVPLLTGTNLDEFTLFSLMASQDLDDERVVRRMAAVLPDPEAALAAYRSARPDASPFALWTAAMTDQVFRIPAVRLAEAQARHQPDTWMYLFTWPSTAFGGRLGSCHALEIPFVFNMLGARGVAEFCGEGPPGDVALAMHDAWAAFARTGDPSHPGIPEWPRYEPGRRATLEFGTARRVLDDPQATERAVWEGVL
jgi:para-nitrobenzyl esterase